MQKYYTIINFMILKLESFGNTFIVNFGYERSSNKEIIYYKNRLESKFSKNIKVILILSNFIKFA